VDRDSYSYLTPAKDFDGTIQDFSVRLRVTDARGATSQSPLTFSLRQSSQDCNPKLTSPAPSANAGSTRITAREAFGTISRGTSRPVRDYTVIPSGKVTITATGNCSMSRNQARFIAGSTSGTCLLTITSQTTKATTIVKLDLQVR
jgi:hypothetical protein